MSFCHEHLEQRRPPVVWDALHCGALLTACARESRARLRPVRRPAAGRTAGSRMLAPALPTRCLRTKADFAFASAPSKFLACVAPGTCTG